MGNNLTVEAFRGVRFLRNTCTGIVKRSEEEHVPTPTDPAPLLPQLSSTPELPPPAMVRNSVVRKAMRRPSKGIKKCGSVSLDWDDGDSVVLIEKVRGDYSE